MGSYRVGEPSLGIAARLQVHNIKVAGAPNFLSHIVLLHFLPSPRHFHCLSTQSPGALQPCRRAVLYLFDYHLFLLTLILHHHGIVWQGAGFA